MIRRHGVGRRLLVCETTGKAAEPAMIPGWLLPVEPFTGITVCIREPRLWMIKIAWSASRQMRFSHAARRDRHEQRGFCGHRSERGAGARR